MAVSRRDEIRVEPRPEVVDGHPPAKRFGWIEWAGSTDHKRVGILYLGTAFSFLVVALVELLLMRIQLVASDMTFLAPEVFNQILSVYGTTALFLFGIPVAAGLASYVVPLQLGARGVAFPRLNLLSWWLYLAAGVVLYATFLWTPPDAGVHSSPPLSDTAFLPGQGIDAWIVSVGLVALSSITFAINLIVTITRMRAPGMFWRRMPLFSWAALVYSWTLLIISPVLLAALTMLFVDRNFDGTFFVAGEGGRPMLWQHLFWFYVTPAYFLLMIPAFGVISEILPSLSRKPIFSRGAIAGSIVSIAVLSGFLWMQNLYSAPIAIGWQVGTVVVAMLIAVPLALLFFNWIATVWGGAVLMRAPMLFAFGAISVMLVGLLGELMHSVVPIGWLLGGSQDATAATHFALIGGSVFGSFAGLYYWFPKMTGRTMGETLGRVSFWAMLIGTYLTFVPLMSAGLSGQPVDVFTYFDGWLGVSGANAISTIGFVLLAAGIVATLANVMLSIRGGARAGHDPWGGSTLEWFTTSPPPENNFDVRLDVSSAEPLHDIRVEAALRAGDPPPRKHASSVGEPVA